METLSPEKILIKKQKKIIIILSVLLAVISALFISVEIYINIPKNPIEITFNKIYIPEYSTSYRYEVKTNCKQPTIINVNDFSYKTSEQSNEYISVNTIVYNNTEYQRDDSFIISPYSTNTLTFYYIQTRSSEIYYKFQKIELNTTKTFKG